MTHDDKPGLLVGDRNGAGLLVGNRMVLAGAVLYLLEWVAIVAAAIPVPLGATASGADVLAAYSGHQEALGWAAGWFSVVLLGRILIVTGLRTALADSGRREPLMDFAVAAMAVSVTLEIATYAMTAGASWYAGHGGSLGQVRGLDSAAFYVNNMIWGPCGVAVVCCGVAMWRSALFPRVLNALALVGGAALILAGVAFQSPRFTALSDGLTSGAVLFWVWMLWTGVLLWRATRRVATPVG
jgi:hypothetical protein